MTAILHGAATDRLKRPAIGMTRLWVSTLVVVAACFHCIGCVAPRPFLNPAVVYQAPEFDQQAFSGQSIMTASLIGTNASGSGSRAITADRIDELLEKQHPDLKITAADTFWNRLKALDSALVPVFSDMIQNQDVIRIQTADSAWNQFPTALALCLYLEKAYALRAYNGDRLRRFTLFAEVWDVAEREVVWRTEVRAVSGDRSSPDHELVWEAVVAAVEKLPGYRPSLNTQDW